MKLAKSPVKGEFLCTRWWRKGDYTISKYKFQNLK